MNVLINLDNLVISYKHLSTDTLCDLAWIELQTSAYIVGPCDPLVLRGLTVADLEIIYRNTTSEPIKFSSYSQAQSAVLKLIQEMEPTDCNPFEVSLQAGCLNENESGFYKYVKGSKKPALVQELFINCAKAAGLSEADLQTLAKQPVTSGSRVKQTPPANRATLAAKAAQPVAQAKLNPLQERVFNAAGVIAKQFAERNEEAFEQLKAFVSNELNDLSSFTVAMQLSQWKKLFWNA